jgi:hypothetical protein
VPFYQSEDLHQMVAGSRLIIVNEGGHYSYRRHWEEWNALTNAFIGGAEGVSK